MRVIIYIALSLLSIMACNKDDVKIKEPVIENISEYTGLKINAEYIFKVDSVVFNYSGGTENVITQSESYLREIYTDIISEENAPIQYRIERYTSENSEGPWKLLNVTYAYTTDVEYIRVDENLPYRKLVAPIYDETYWNPFSLFSTDSITYNIDGNILVPFNTDHIARLLGVRDTTINNHNFPIIDVEYQNFDDEILFKTYSREIYAKDIGKIRREYFLAETNSCNVRNNELILCKDIPWLEKATSGLKITEELISWK